LASLLASHPGTLVVVAVDLFALAIEPDPRGRAHAIAGVLGAQPGVVGALARHLDTGGRLCLVAGNHDIDLGETAIREVLGRALGTCGLSIWPWLVRVGGVHVEHGHVHDPDNAPEHPLVVGAPSLGAHFGHEFLVPTGAYDFLHGNDSTPARLFLRAFTRYGWRGPYVVGRYFVAAFGALGRSGPWYRAHDERALGRVREEQFGLETGIEPTVRDALLELVATPTLRSFRRTFARTYLDRSLPTAAVVLGAMLYGLGRRRFGVALGAAGLTALVASWRRGRDRYQGSVAERLRRAARSIGERARAELVVLGHSHRPEFGDGYANAGSFTFPGDGREGARPFLDVALGSGRPTAALRWWQGERSL
jgi:hypothetical protein